MRLLVTGAAGFIGSHLVDRLLADGHEVAGLDDLSTGRLGNLAGARCAGGLSFSRFDLLSGGLAELVARARPEVVCHLAAQTDVGRSIADPLHDTRVDVLGTVALLDACVLAGVRKVVLTSSGAVYGRPASLPVTERAALHPTSTQGAAKVAGETYLAAYASLHGLAGTSLRLGDVYGPRQDPHGEAGVVAFLARAMLEGRPTTVYGDGTSSHDHVHVEDVVDALCGVLDERGDGRRFNVGTGVSTTMRELYALLAEATGAPDTPVPAPARLGERPAIALDSSSLRRTTGWVPRTPLTDGLASTGASLR